MMGFETMNTFLCTARRYKPILLKVILNGTIGISNINIFIRISVQKDIWKRKVFDDFFHCLFVVGILCVGLRPGWALTDTSGNKGAREKK